MLRGTMLRLALLAIAYSLVAAISASERPAQVIVLATLHQMHEEMPGYSYQDLSDVIERLEPDVLCIEVRAENMANRSPEATKREYPAAIYPLIDKHHYRVYPLEPSEPVFGALVKPYAAANQAFAASAPAQAVALGKYYEGAYAGMRAYWTKPARVNDVVTDQVMRAKHDLQQAIIGPGEQAGWQGWNRHFLAVVARAVQENPGKRILITVGAEHGYWLREHLAHLPGAILLDTAALLDDPR